MLTALLARARYRRQEMQLTGNRDAALIGDLIVEIERRALAEAEARDHAELTEGKTT